MLNKDLYDNLIKIFLYLIQPIFYFNIQASIFLQY